MAIDREFVARKVWLDSMVPAYSMVPPGIDGYEPAVADFAEMDQIDRAEEAARILADLGYGPGHPLKLELRYNTSENHKNTALAIQEQLRPLGIEVTLLNTDTATHYGYLEGDGDFDLARAGWLADWSDPLTFLELSKGGSSFNYSNYSNPEFDSLLEEVNAPTSAPEDRFPLLARAERVVVDDVGNIPLMFYASHNLVSSELVGWQDNLLDIHPSRFISFEQPAAIAAATAPSAPAAIDFDPGVRVALVIGNSDYSTVSELPNADDDAELIGAALKQAGFAEVTVLQNLDRTGLGRALQAFAREAHNAEWAVIYYARHGMELDCENYLNPIDAQLRRRLRGDRPRPSAFDSGGSA
jgi:hypothetical protein